MLQLLDSISMDAINTAFIRGRAERARHAQLFATKTLVERRSNWTRINCHPITRGACAERVISDFEPASAGLSQPIKL